MILYKWGILKSMVFVHIRKLWLIVILKGANHVPMDYRCMIKTKEDNNSVIGLELLILLHPCINARLDQWLLGHAWLIWQTNPRQSNFQSQLHRFSHLEIAAKNGTCNGFDGLAWRKSNWILNLWLKLCRPKVIQKELTQLL